MLTLLNLAAVLTLQTPTPPPPPPPVCAETPDGGMGDHGGPRELDKDGDGRISPEEFAGPMSEDFARMDTDGSGWLSPEELRAGHGPGGPAGDREMNSRHGPDGGDDGGPGNHRMERRRGDPDGGPEGPGGPGPGGDGPMTCRETGGDTRIEIRRLGDGEGGNALDTDGDGRISEAEFLAPMRAAFARMDTDHSGSIEAAEKGGERQIRVITRHREGPGGN